MADSTEHPTVGEVGGLVAQLRDLSARLGRGEDVPQDEIDAVMDRKVWVIGRIDEGALL